MTTPKKHHVKFPAEKKVRESVRVTFERKDGTKTSFPAHKTVTKKVKIDFMAKNKKQK
jgi:hypothetical protein